ncbi:MAG: DUF2157 domain-containing protein [Alkalinema sp. RU_4_3]|nr:DUF2157 domain-containing protein [Alkalinema sp. RU_4_3]
MPSDRFRHDLKNEVRQWVEEGLINDQQLDQLVDRYSLHQLDGAAKNRFVGVLVGLGCLLIGLGMITFIAANWQALGRPVKIGLLATLFLGSNLGGFYLWDRGSVRLGRLEENRLGAGLLLIGNLVLGACMALSTQMFHLGSDSYLLFLWWSLAVLAMAYAVRQKWLAMLAIALMGQAYWLSVMHTWFFWSRSQTLGVLPDVGWLPSYMAIAAVVMFLPLAHWCRSRTVFVMAWIAIVTAFFSGAMTNADNLIPKMLAFTLPGLLLWSYDAGRPEFGSLAKRLGGGTIAFSLCACSVFGVNLMYAGHSRGYWDALLGWPGLGSGMMLGIVAIVQWVRLLRSDRGLNLTVLGIVVLQAIALTLSGFGAPGIDLGGLMLNALTAVWGIGLIRESLSEGDRSMFWSGLATLTTLVMAKVFLSTTMLTFKALMLVVCGVLIVMAGIWFEKNVRSVLRSGSLS